MAVPKKHLILAPILTPSGIAIFCRLSDINNSLEWALASNKEGSYPYLDDSSLAVVASSMTLIFGFALFGVFYGAALLVVWLRGGFNEPAFCVPKDVWRRLEKIKRLADGIDVSIKEGDDDKQRLANDRRDKNRLERAVQMTTDYFMGDYPESDVKWFTERLDLLDNVATELRAVRAEPLRFENPAAHLTELDGGVDAYLQLIGKALQKQDPQRAQKTADQAGQMRHEAAAAEELRIVKADSSGEATASEKD